MDGSIAQASHIVVGVTGEGLDCRWAVVETVYKVALDVVPAAESCLGSVQGVRQVLAETLY